ncbi:hypothetical protein ACTZWW_04110 [Salinarimonas sp. NSM]|uniref:hypothetical protein n=1 Tax=Salinarimonas sp. NSM TaxID=3458003 RepID=UPI0040374225
MTAQIYTASRAAVEGPRLSTLFRDPFVRRAFERAEKDGGASFAVPAPRRPVLSGGEADRVLEQA